MKKTSIVIFGITGDLAKKKLLPAISKLRQNIKIIGFARRPFMMNGTTHVQGGYNDRKSYKELKKQIIGNKLYYLAVPPSVYPAILENLHNSGLHKNAKILIEKPFGSSLKTARHLNRLLRKIFDERQIYRVDHYLGKENVSKIARMEFVLKKIKKIEIKLLEKEGVGTRGDFYDKIGSLKDVGQNHLLAVLSLVIGQNVHRLQLKEAVRGQYRGYPGREETETYFKLRAMLGSIEIVLESGKKMKQNKSEIKIYFKDGKRKVFKIGGGGYERVLCDAIAGKQEIFPSIKEVIDQWKFTERAEKMLKKTPLKRY